MRGAGRDTERDGAVLSVGSAPRAAVAAAAGRTPRRLAPVGALALATLVVGCGGGIAAPDLFILQRTGSGPGARLTLLVNEEGGVHCYKEPAHPGPTLKLSDPLLVQARAIQEELKEPAEAHVSLPARAGSVLSYYLRDENGSVRFADDSTGQPKVFRNLVLFVLQVAQQVCKLPQQGA